MKREDFPAPLEGIVLTHFLTVKDTKRSSAFYSGILGGQVLLEGEPTVIKLANSWIIVNVGGGPTEDKPDVTLAAPSDLKNVSSFMNIRVADIKARYEEWRSKGAKFLTPPMDRGAEIRCYMSDPDGYIIEVGEAAGMLEMFD
ncbi:MAG: VOC family protein [Thaumarchaeota archaeon]|nr:VOC family protein [Nitrososphaerota archaeon]